MQKKLTLALLVTACFAAATAVQGQSLKGSKTSMARQHQEALKYGYTFIQNAQGVANFVDAGHLVKIERGRHVDLHDVSYPYARPAVKTFVDRLSVQYTAQCGEKLTVTSLTRPKNRQPANASSESVHPTGMAVDLRIPPPGKCRSWLEKTLLELEADALLDVTRERNPPHYHVAVFTQSYEQYAEQKAVAPSAGGGEYIVRRGDTLSVIATRTGATIAQLRAANNLRSDLIRAGEKLVVPGLSTPVATNEVATVSEVTHKVRRGETLWRIAKQYGTSINLVRMNNGLGDDFLQVGQVLKISLGNGSR